MSPFKHWWNWSLWFGPSVLSKESSWIPTLYPSDFMLIFQGLKYLFLIQAALLTWFTHLWRVGYSSVHAAWTPEYHLCPGWDPELGLILGWGLCCIFPSALFWFSVLFTASQTLCEAASVSCLLSTPSKWCPYLSFCPTTNCFPYVWTPNSRSNFKI